MTTGAGATAVTVARVGIRFATLPNVDTRLFSSAGTGVQCGIIFKQSDSKLYVGTDTAGVMALGATGVSVTTGAWYYVDLIVNRTANTIDGAVNGSACGQYSNAVTVAGTSAQCILAVANAASAPTADVFFDDLVLSQTAADYPFGDGYVNHFVPTADGTHNVAGAADFRRGDTTTDITNATTTAYQLVDDVPLDDVTPDTDDHIRIVAPPAVTDYVELVFGPAPGISTPTTGPRAVEVIAEVFAAGTLASDEIIKLNDNGSLDNIYDGTGVAGVTTGTYKRKHYADPPSAATVWNAAGDGGNGDFRDLRVRYGYATDANPDKSLMCIMIEAEFASAVVTPQQKNWIRTGHVPNMYGVRPGTTLGRTW